MSSHLYIHSKRTFVERWRTLLTWALGFGSKTSENGAKKKARAIESKPKLVATCVMMNYGLSTK